MCLFFVCSVFFASVLKSTTFHSFSFLHILSFDFTMRMRYAVACARVCVIATHFVSRRKVHDTSCSIFHHILYMDNYSDYIKQVHINALHFLALFTLISRITLAIHSSNFALVFFTFLLVCFVLCSLPSIEMSWIFGIDCDKPNFCRTKKNEAKNGILTEYRFYRKKEPKKKQRTPYSHRWPMSIEYSAFGIKLYRSTCFVQRSPFSHVKLPILHGINFIYSVFWGCRCAQPWFFPVNLLAR